MAAAAAGYGGLRGLVFLRMLLANIGVMVLAEQQVIPHAGNAFHADGSLIDAARQQAVLALGQQLSSTVASLSG
jgi:hypothetical protein